MRELAGQFAAADSGRLKGTCERGRVRRPRRNEEPGAACDQPVTFMSAIREAIAGGTVFGTSAAAAPGRAERLGLSPVAQAASTALAMPFGFLALGDDRRAVAELARMINGLAVLAAFRDLVPAACREPIR